MNNTEPKCKVVKLMRHLFHTYALIFILTVEIIVYIRQYKIYRYVCMLQISNNSLFLSLTRPEFHILIILINPGLGSCRACVPGDFYSTNIKPQIYVYTRFTRSAHSNQKFCVQYSLSLRICIVVFRAHI